MILKHSTIAVLASVTALLSVVTVGCGAKDSSSDGDDVLGTNEAQLVDDDSESASTDDDLESGVDEPLSGATDADPGTPGDGKTVDEVLAKVKLNAGGFFKPAGCIESTIDKNVITHKLSKCTGPWGLANFDGTVTSTWTRADDGTITVVHAATGLNANGASITGSRTITYTRSGTVITKKRIGSWTGTTAKGKPISHDANFVTTYDDASKCLTRDGSAQSTIGGRSFERTIDGYKRCGIGRLGCPESGTLSLSKTKSSDTLTLTIKFLGGVKYEVTRPSGRVVDRALICNPNAS